MNITKEELEATIKALFAVDDYKPLGQIPGGWYPFSHALWAILSTSPETSVATLRQMVRASFAVPGEYAELFTDFVTDLFNALSLLANGAAEIVQNAAAGASSMVAGIGAGSARLRESTLKSMADFDLSGRLGSLDTTLVVIVLVTGSMYALLGLMVQLTINDQIKGARRLAARQSNPPLDRITQSPLRQFG